MSNVKFAIGCTHLLCRACPCRGLTMALRRRRGSNPPTRVTIPGDPQGLGTLPRRIQVTPSPHWLQRGSSSSSGCHSGLHLSLSGLTFRTVTRSVSIFPQVHLTFRVNEGLAQKVPLLSRNGVGGKQHGSGRDPTRKAANLQM